MRSASLLLVDDDRPFRSELAAQLVRHEGFALEEADSGAEALRKSLAQHFALIVLDVGLPDINGYEVCRLMRGAEVTCPILMLTAFDSDEDAVRGLDAGANDYVTKPFRLPVLLARIRALLRQYAASDDATLVIGPYLFRPGARLLVHGERNEKIHLTAKESALLSFLHRAGGRAVPHDVLLREVWDYHSDADTHTLQTHIYRLRQKMERDPTQAELLVTEGKGYRLVSG